jgi:hypothetical protein
MSLFGGHTYITCSVFKHNFADDVSTQIIRHKAGAFRV